MNSTECLPLSAGYELGQLIKKTDFELPNVCKLQRIRKQDLNGLRKEHKELINKLKEAAKNVVESKFISEDLSLSTQKMDSMWKELCGLHEMERQLRAASDSTPNVHESLPIDWKNLGSIVSEKTTQPSTSDSFQYCTISQEDVKKTDNQTEVIIGDFLARILPKEGITCQILSTDTLITLSAQINHLLVKSSNITLFGSFITLGTTKVVDISSLLIKGGHVSKNILKHMDDYFVLTQVALGAAFIGIGTHVSVIGTEEDTKKKYSQKSSHEFSSCSASLSTVSNISFISLGSIAKINAPSIQSVSIDTIYKDWKDSVVKPDSKAGFPIRFGASCLRSVLESNGYIGVSSEFGF